MAAKIAERFYRDGYHAASEIRELKQPAKDGSTKNTRSRKDGDDGT